MHWINTMMVCAAIGLVGCSTSQESTLPQPDTNVNAVWAEKMGRGTNDQLLQMRHELRRDLSPEALARRQSDYTRDSYREVFNQFPRLPNPDVVFYVYPHKTGSMPVPGYSTVFPLYERVHYATPGDQSARMLEGIR